MDTTQTMFEMYKKDPSVNTVMYLYQDALQGGVLCDGKPQKKMDSDGYTKILFPQDSKHSDLRMQLFGNQYRLHALYVFSESIHESLFSDSVVGELLLEYKPVTRGQSRIMICICLVAGVQGNGVQETDDTMVLSGHSGDMKTLLTSYFANGIGGVEEAWLYHHDTIVVMKRPMDSGSWVRNVTTGVNVDGLDRDFDFPFLTDTLVDIHVQHHGISQKEKVGATSSPSFVGSMFSWWGGDDKEGFREGLDFEKDLNQADMGAGFGSFSSTIQQSAQQFNQAGEDYVFDFNKKKSTGDAPTEATSSQFVDCVPIYDNADQVSTFVIPYGTTLSDEATKMFMTGTFQMFYTLLVAFVILFLTPILYKGYFAVAMRRGSSDDPEYGNKITYSTNFHFMLYSILMILGVLIDAVVYTQNTTELGFSIMLMVFVVCTYMFTLLLRSAGFDEKVYGNMHTRYSMSELTMLYYRFMGENYDGLYSFWIPAVLVAVGFGISIGIYQSKSGTKDMPFGAMISLFFIGLFLVLSTMGTFMKKAQRMRAAEVIH